MLFLLSGILKLHQSDLLDLELNTIEDVGGFLGKLPPSLDSEVLFGRIHVTSKKQKVPSATL